MTFERGMVSGEIPGQGSTSSRHETPRSNPPDVVDRETGLSLRFIREYDPLKDVWPSSFYVDVGRNDDLRRAVERALTPWDELHPGAWPVGTRTHPSKCCDGINGSHTQLCPVPWQHPRSKTVHCWCCGDDHPSNWAGLWGDKGYRCMGCEGCDYFADGVGCLKLAAEARRLMGCE